jgi:hypothetical protein
MNRWGVHSLFGVAALAAGAPAVLSLQLALRRYQFESYWGFAGSPFVTPEWRQLIQHDMDWRTPLLHAVPSALSLVAVCLCWALIAWRLRRAVHDPAPLGA